MTAPPRTPDLLLHALGAEAGFRDAVLGDLAEEFAARAGRDGAAAARRWYYREAIRATPHLLANWARRLRPGDVRHLAGVVLTAYVLLLALGGVVVPLLHGAAVALGISEPGGLPWAGRVGPAVALPLAAVSAMTGGYIAASLGVRAPLASAVALGVAWSCLGLVVGALADTTGTWDGSGVATAAVVIVGSTLGGVRRVCAARPSRRRGEPRSPAGA